MPVISRFLGIIVYMYYRDHAPPHFHAKYGGQEAIIEIHNGNINGYLPPRVLSLVQEWRQLHIEELNNAWQAAVERKPLPSIEPLE